jgi:hypothetical protein
MLDLRRRQFITLPAGARSRKSVDEPSPAGGLGAGLGRQGSMKPFGRGRIRNIGV